MIGFKIKDRVAYKKVTDAFKKLNKGASIVDVVSETALPINTVRETVPKVADEYSARLQVTESGEILYSFPNGFKSKYRGFRAGLRRFSEKALKWLKIAGKNIFKVWIMVMLVGYFALFMLIALAALLLSMVSNQNSESRSDSRGGGGLFFTSAILNTIVRIWFYSELVKTVDRGYYGNRAPPKPKGKPLYKAIFSFIFGDDDPNGDWLSKEKQVVIAHLQNNRGVISLPEFMILTGFDPQTAESKITAYCAEFGGLPEATEDGTVVYRFDELLLRADKRDRSFQSSSPIKRLQTFSSNPKKMNVGFSIINSVNLLFGSYFLFYSMTLGNAITSASLEGASYLYGIAYILASMVINNPLLFLLIGLGIVPVIFSFLFWIIPVLRNYFMKKENEHTKLENLRKIAYSMIWSNPKEVKAEDIQAPTEECSPKNFHLAQDSVIKEMGSYAMPDVTINSEGKTVYVFNELDREKTALKKYRDSINPENSSLGKVIFDSN